MHSKIISILEAAANDIVNTAIGLDLSQSHLTKFLTEEFEKILTQAFINKRANIEISVGDTLTLITHSWQVEEKKFENKKVIVGEKFINSFNTVQYKLILEEEKNFPEDRKHKILADAAVLKAIKSNSIDKFVYAGIAPGPDGDYWSHLGFMGER